MSKIYLRELRRVDLTRLNQWRHQRELIENLGAPFRYIDLEAEEQWFDNYLNSRKNNIRLAICLTENNEHIGNAYLLNLDDINRQANFSILIGSNHLRGKGYGFEATMKMLAHGFFDLNLYRIELQVVETNQPALSLYKKCGFKEEGRRRSAVFKSGQYKDMIMFSMLRDEFKEHSF